MKKKIKFLLATIMMLAGTMVSQAQTETLLITINSAGHGEDEGDGFISGSRTFNNIATITFSAEVENDDDNDGWYNTDWSNKILSVTPAAGYTITKVKFYCWSGSAFDKTSPFEATLYANQMYVNGSSYGPSGVTKIEVYGYAAHATVDVTGVTLSQTSASMTVGGETLTLTATVAPANAANKTVTWTTSDPTVATVTNGVVTAVGAGTATITATATNGTAATSDDKTATCTVTVSPAKYAVTVKDGTEDAANWTITPSTATAGETVTVTYSGTKKVKSVKAKKK